MPSFRNVLQVEAADTAPSKPAMRLCQLLTMLNPAALRSLSVCVFYATVSVALSLCNKVSDVPALLSSL